MKLPRLSTWLFSGLCTLAASSCTSDETEPTPAVETVKTVQVTYDATQCADPWGFTSTEQQLVTTSAAYLVQHGAASYHHQTITKTVGAACASCSCPKGMLITGSVSEPELAAAIAVGFKKL